VNPLATAYVDWSALWQILVIGLLAGAGLVAVYSVGLVCWSKSGYGQTTPDGAAAPRHLVGLVAAMGCFAVVVGGVVWGIVVMLAK
jgi:hypothetical protein